jgi:type II secretory pathway component PulF
LILAGHLEQGLPLSQAAGGARLRMATPMRLAVRLGEALGMVGPAMRQQLDDSVEADAILRRVVIRLYYLWAVVLVLMGVLTFVMLRIVPVFQKMFQEFGLELPSLTKTLIHACNWFVQFGWFLTAPFTLFAGIVGTILLLWGALHFVGFTVRDFPGIWRLFKRYDGALVMRGLALAVRRGVGLTEALTLLENTYPIQEIARRIRGVRLRVEQGAVWQQSLRNTGLISGADAAVLAAAERADNLPWALEEMADSALRRQAYRLQLVVHCLFPLIVLLIGLMVGFFVIGLFLPLVALVQGLT